MGIDLDQIRLGAAVCDIRGRWLGKVEKLASNRFLMSHNGAAFWLSVRDVFAIEADGDVTMQFGSESLQRHAVPPPPS